MHQIKCILCGKTINVDYKSGIAACPYCDTVFELPEVSIHPVSISQHDNPTVEIDVKDVHECENCGARINVRDNLHDGTLICPYCDTHYRVAHNTQPKSTPAQKTSTSSPKRKPFYTNWVFWLLVLLFLFRFGNTDFYETKSDYSSPETVIGSSNSESADANGLSITIGRLNALRSAKSYIRSLDLSYEELIEHLEYKKYSHEDAVFAADNCGADWYKEALDSAKSYLSWGSFSYKELIHQLEFEKFTPEQAKYAVDNCGADWFEQAAKSAKSYLRYFNYSKDGLTNQLLHEDFTQEQVEYAVDNCGADWFEQAAKCAESYLQHSGYSRDGLIDLLLRKGFTQEQAEYAAEQNGY